MELCEGTKIGNNEPCHRRIFRCHECGATGCSHGHKECSDQTFVQSACQRCGAMGKYRAVTGATEPPPRVSQIA